jgi:hypothetical protein
MTEPGGRIPPWPDLIAAMGEIQRRASEVSDLYSFTVPGVAATEEQLRAAEERLGHPLDAQHREFLSYGNGWPEFYLDTSLLSTEDIGQGEAWAEVNRGLDAFYGALDANSGIPPREEIYPISHDPHDATVFAIWLGGPETDGGHPVLWLPWPDTDPYSNFFEFFSFVYREHEEELGGGDGS